MNYQLSHLLGKSETHLEYLADHQCFLHKDVVDAFRLLEEKAKMEAGISLKIASGFRSYERQSVIWNEKAQAKREVWNQDATATLHMKKLPPTEKMWAILRWSAIPGFSRHHWGSDFDVYDQNKIKNKDQLKLLPSEYEDKHSPMLELHLWLTSELGRSHEQHFYRPYEKDRGGIAREPWHLSFRPVADRFHKQIHRELFVTEILNSHLELKEEILQNADEILRRFIFDY